MSEAPWYQSELAGDEDPAALRARGQAQVDRIRGKLSASPPQEAASGVPYITTREALQEWLDEERRGTEHDSSTGWKSLDALLGKPMRHSEVILIAARTGVGKTWAIQGILENILGVRTDASGLLIQLEMPAFHMAERFATHALDVAPGGARALARGDLTVEDVLTASPLLDRIGLVTASLRVDQIPDAITSMEDATGKRPEIVAVDYLGLLRGAGRSRYEQASEVSRSLKQIANDQGVLILAAAQLSRDGGDGTKRPTLDMLRDSGVAEEASDRVLGLWRPQPVEDDDPGVITDGLELGLVVLKNRFGPSGGETLLRYDYALRLAEAEDDGIPW